MITAHRRESFGAPFRDLCEAIAELAARFPQVDFVYPVHLNPNVRQPVGDILRERHNVRLIEPVDYFEMVHLMRGASLILTDSGGVQEEAPSLCVPVLVMRDTTERPEGVEEGLVKLVGTAKDRIIEEASNVIERGSFVPEEKRGRNPYGDGKAARRIVSVLVNGRMPNE
ncbi:MAG: UDP-N-acetylglucosamine 2-epimerase [Bdellovibrionota bacterium]